jgi:hypothetical protein
LGINSVSTKAVNGYELGLQIELASYWIGISVIGLNPLQYVGLRLEDRWATMAGYWAT